MTATYRVTIKPEKSGTQVLTIAQPSLRVTISKGVGGAALPTEKTFGAAKVYGSLVSGYASNGLPNADTQAAIDYALAQGYPAWSIIWMYQGEAVAGSVSSTAPVPAFIARAGFTPPSVSATVFSETASASASIPAFSCMASFIAPSVSAQQLAAATVPPLAASVSFTAPTVTGIQAATASASVPQFSAVFTFAAPTVYATRNASATVPQFAASATFAAPTVAVTPAGATAATATVPSFGAVAALSAPSVTGVSQALATVTVPQFTATSTFTSPSVAAKRVATANVPSFGATATFAAPTVAGVQQAAAVSATATVPSFTARVTFTAPSAAGTTVAGGGSTITENFDTAIAPTGANGSFAATASVQGWTIANSGTDPGTFDVYDVFVGAKIYTSASGFAGNGLSVGGCYTEDAEGGAIARSGFKLSKTFAGTFSAGTFTLKYKAGSSVLSSVSSIKVNGVSAGALTFDNTWRTATISVDATSSILLEITCSPTTNPPNIQVMFIDSISFS